MLEKLIVFLIIVLCAFLIGRKYYRQWRSALDPDSSPSCASSCCSCDVSGCSEKK